MKKNLTTNIIRIVAAILVIFSHSFALSQNTGDYLDKYTKGVINFGAFAVAILFAISGYYIAQSIDKKGINKFFKKRVLRLIPSLFIVVISCIIILGLFFSKLSFTSYITNLNTYKYLLNVGFIPIHNLPGVFENNIYGAVVNGALWTMTVQVLCYIYAYLAYLLKSMNKENKNKYLAVSLGMGLLGFAVFNYLNISILISMIRPFLCFVIGGYLYYSVDFLKKKNLLIIMVLILVLLLINNYIILNILLIFCVPYIVIYMCVNNNIESKNKILDEILSSSYELYLIGFPIQQAITNIYGGQMNPYLNFVLALLIAIPLSVIIRKLSIQMTNTLKF